MAIFTFFEDNIYTYFDKIIELSLNERKTTKNKDSLVAINLNIILCSACFLEGIFEDRGKMLLGYYRVIYNSIDLPLFEIRKPMNTFYNNLEEYLSANISQTTGIDKYNTFYKLLLDKSFKKDSYLSTMIEGISALFNLRNVIAHGRLIHAYNVNAYYTNGTEENFVGGYKKTEEYLKKQKLIDKGFMKSHKSSIYFSNEIADHFYSLTKKFVEGLDNFIRSNLIVSKNIISQLNEYNELNKTKYDIFNYFRIHGIH